MKKILLFLGYVAGVLVGSKYAKKSETTTKTKNTKKADIGEQAMDAGKDFIEMHKKAFQALKKEYWTAENKKLILSKKKDLEKFFELAKAEIMEANTTLKEHGIDVKTIGDKVESIYTEKKSMLETLAKSEAAQSAKRKLAAYVKKIKASL